jgi:hypothetical protein
MTDLFTVRIPKLKKLYQEFPTKFRKAESNVLNSFAFGARNSAIETLRKKMIVRDRRFLEAGLKVKKSSFKDPISEMGSIYRPSFSGWREQQTGERVDRNRIATVAARRGNIQNKIAPSVRMKRSNEFLRDSEVIPGRTGAGRSAAMIAYVQRKKHNKPFILSGSTKYPKGLYRRKRKRIVLLQKLGDVAKTVKRIRWMDISIQEYFTNNSIRRTWAQSIARILRVKKS